MSRKICLCAGLLTILFNSHAGTLCTPDSSTAFSDFQNKAFRISNDVLGVNSLFSQCTDLSNEVALGQLNNCMPALVNPINGLGLNPIDKLLYGLAPTDSLGIGSHLELTLPFPSPGQPGDIMKADAVNLYKIGNDAGFQNIGSINPPSESVGLPAGTNQVVPIVHSAASFNATGDLFVLAYRTNYTSSANIPAGTAQVLYQAPQIVIGKIDSAILANANGGAIATTWINIDNTTDANCLGVVEKFRDDTNVFSVCLVNQYLTTGDESAALQSCLASTSILDKGIHDFAVSPLNGHFYGYDSMTYDNKDVLVDVDPNTNIATCTEIADIGNTTGVLSSLSFSQQNKLVAIFANQNTGNWIDVSTGVLTTLPSSITSAPFSDGSSLPFTIVAQRGGTNNDLIFKNDFEPIIDLIFSNDFEPPDVTAISLFKSGNFIYVNNDELAQVGETIQYGFTVSNTGDLLLTNIMLDDPLIPITGNLASLPVASSDNSTFSGTYTLTQNDIDSGSVSNIASVTATDPSNNTVTAMSNNGVAVIVDLPTIATIELMKRGTFVDENNDELAQFGEKINYTFTLTNTGNTTLNTLFITDPILNIPTVLPLLNVESSDSTSFFASYTLSQSDIDNGFVSNLATAFAKDPAGNMISVTSDNGIANIVNLNTSASMSLTKNGSYIDFNNDGIVQAGDKINYSFTVANQGDLTLSNLSISDSLVTVTGQLASLNVSAVDNLTFSAQYTLIQTDIDAGFVSNIATLNATDPDGNMIMTQSNNGIPLVTNFVATAQISLVKAGEFVDANSNGLADVNETINYTFVVKNIGSLTLNNITITDPLIAIPATLNSLAVSDSDSSTFLGSYSITQSDIDNGFVSNTALVNAFDPSNNNVNAPSNGGVALITPLAKTASLSLIKTEMFNDTNSDEFAQVGETISYAFDISNTGNVTLSNVMVSDPLFNIAASIPTFAVGANDTSTFSGIYVLTQQDIDNGIVANLATAAATDPSANTINIQSNNGIALITNLPIFSCPMF